MVTSKMTRGVVFCFFPFYLSTSLYISPHLLLAYTLSCDLDTTHFACRLRFSLRHSAAPVFAAETRLFAPFRPKPSLRRRTTWRQGSKVHQVP